MIEQIIDDRPTVVPQLKHFEGGTCIFLTLQIAFFNTFSSDDDGAGLKAFYISELPFCWWQLGLRSADSVEEIKWIQLLKARF